MNKFLYRNPSGSVELKEFAADSALSLLRVSDPVLEGISQGFQTDIPMVGDKIFNPVQMDKESGRFPAWGKEAFKIYDTKRGLYQPVKHMVSQTGYIQASLSQYALGFEVDLRELNEYAGTPDQYLTSKQNMVMTSLRIQRENAQAVLATTSSSYASGFAVSGASKQWGSTGDPVKDLLQAILQVQKQNGRRPDNVTFSPAAWILFINNASVLDRIKYQGTNVNPANVTENMVAQLLSVQTVQVGYAVSGAGAGGGKGQADLTMGFIWDSVQSANVVISITGRGLQIPAFGYTYEKKDSLKVESYYLPQTQTQNYDTSMFYDAFVTLNNAGFLYYSLA